MKRPALSFVWVVAILVFSTQAFAQTFEDFKKEIREEYNTFEKETQQKFDNFVNEIDKEFSEYLLNGFTPHKVTNNEFTEQQKPNTVPEVLEIEISGNEIDYEVGVIPTSYQGPAYPGIKKTETTDFEVDRIDVEFLGWPLYFDLDKDFRKIESRTPSDEYISNIWSAFAKTNYNHFIFQVNEVSSILNLNQWGYYQLIKECSKSIYPSNENMQIAFQWAMLTRSRYKAKIGFDDSSLFLLLPSIYKMYDIDYINFNDMNYYVMGGKGKELQTYEKDFSEADILMDVTIWKPFNTNPIKKSRDYHFTHNKEKHTIKLDYDEEMIKFYNTIPLSDIVVYFNSAVGERTKESVKKAFKPLLEGKNNIESANILLSFMQQAFGYKTDQYAYGTEKYFFPDEVLHYQFSDCEDRSVLFAYLVKTLLGKEVIAVGFPGHMATAINLSDEIEGTYLIYNDNKYILADPTYYGAPIGMVLSTDKDDEAVIYPIRLDINDAKKAEQIWKKINEYGGYKSDRLVDFVMDSDGNSFVCGYFIEGADFNGHVLKSKYNDRDLFIAKFDDKLDPIWVRSAEGMGNDIATSLALYSNKDLFITGSFENELSFNETTIVATDAPDVFVANFTTDGELKWARKAGIDKLDHSLDFMFAVKFNPGGEKIMAKLYSQSEDFDYYGINIDKEGNPVVVGSFFSSPGMNSNDYINYNMGSDLDIPVVLYETDAKLKEKEYEATIAGLFSALNLLKANTIEIQGSEIKNTFDTYNNKFSTYASAIYDNLANMRFVKNEKGIVTIKTQNEKPVFLDKIKINSNAKIRVVKYKSGNILVEVLSGIYVGGGSHWLDMNSIKLFKDTGDLLFNFDTDNSVKKLNLKKELLKKS